MFQAEEVIIPPECTLPENLIARFKCLKLVCPRDAIDVVALNVLIKVIL